MELSNTRQRVWSVEGAGLPCLVVDETVGWLASVPGIPHDDVVVGDIGRQVVDDNDLRRLAHPSAPLDDVVPDAPRDRRIAELVLFDVCALRLEVLLGTVDQQEPGVRVALLDSALEDG